MERNLIRKALPLLVACGALADASHPPSTEEALVAHLETAAFTPSKTPNSAPGMSGAVIGVDPATKGLTTYARTPAGTGLPAHWHSAAEYTLLLSGKGKLVLDRKEHEMTPGSYAVIPAKAVHQFTCNAGEDCVLFTRRGGPTDYNFVR